MPDVVLTSGQRRSFARVEIDTFLNAVIGMDDFSETDRFPFFHVGKVVYEDGVVFIEDERE